MPLSKLNPDSFADSVEGNPSLIINGDCGVAQRGTSSTANGYGSVDRFYQGRSGGTRTYEQKTLTTGDPYDEGFRYHFRIVNTTAGSNNATDYVETYYKIEAQDMASSGWNYKSPDSYVTLSFWVRSSVAGTYPIWIRDEDNTSYRYVFTFTIAANTWTKVTHSIPGNSNLVFNNDIGSGLRLQWMAFYGSDYTIASPNLNVWDTTNNIPDFPTTWNTTTGSTFDITGIKLEVGSTATPFVHESYAENLRKCQRYYQRWHDANNAISSGGVWYSNTQVLSKLNFWMLMRTSPTMTASAADWGRCYVDGSSKVTNDSTPFDNITDSGCRLNISPVDTGTAGRGTMIQLNSSGKVIEADAEL